MSTRRKPRSHRPQPRTGARPRTRAHPRPGRPTAPAAGGLGGLGALLPWALAMQAADAAEAEGDAAGALAVMAAHDLGPDGQPFWRPWRSRRLHQVVALGADLPSWAVTRWVLAQAAQDVSSNDALSRSRSALELTRAVTGAPIDTGVRLTDHDWLHRQILLYELGGTHDFVSRVAGPDLLARAGDVRAWAHAPMGGFRLLGPGDRPATLVVEDLATGAETRLADLGGLLDVLPGETVLGRLVPAGAGPMFEAAPLPVPEEFAEDVADDPEAWLEVLSSDACHAAFRRGEIRTDGYEFDIVHDVHPLVWRYVVLGGSMAVDDTPIAPAALAGVCHALAGQVEEPDIDPWPCLAAALLEPGTADALADLDEPDRRLLSALADHAAEPARSVALRLAGRTDPVGPGDPADAG